MPVPSNAWRLRHAAGKAASKLVRHVEGGKKVATPVTVSSAVSMSAQEENAAAINATPAVMVDRRGVAKVRASSWNVVIRPLKKPNGTLALPGARDVIGIYQPDGWNNEDIDRRNFARLQRSQTIIGKRRAEYIERLLMSAYGEKKAQTEERKNSWDGYTYQDVFKQLGSTFKYFQQTTLHSSPTGIGKNLSIGSIETGKVYNLNFESRIKSPARSVVEKGEYVFFIHDPSKCTHGSTEADHYPFEEQQCCEYFPLIPQDGSDVADTVAAIDNINLPQDIRRKATRQRDGRCVVSTASYTIGEVDFGGSALQVAHVVPQSTPQEWSQAMQLAVASQRFATRNSPETQKSLRSLLPSNYLPPLISNQCLENLLLLRSDLHFLFDAWLWSIHPGNKRVVPFASLGASMADYEGVCIAHNSDNPLCMPPKSVLEWHFNYCWSQMLLAQPGPGFTKQSAQRGSVIEGQLGQSTEAESNQAPDDEVGNQKKVDGHVSTTPAPSSSASETPKFKVPDENEYRPIEYRYKPSDKQAGKPVLIDLESLKEHISYLNVTRSRAKGEYKHAQASLDEFLHGRQRRLRARKSSPAVLEEHERKTTLTMRRRVAVFERLMNFATEHIMIFENIVRNFELASKKTRSSDEQATPTPAADKVEIAWSRCTGAMVGLHAIWSNMKGYKQDMEFEVKWYQDTKKRLSEGGKDIEPSRAMNFFKKSKEKIASAKRRLFMAEVLQERIKIHIETLKLWMNEGETYRLPTDNKTTEQDRKELEMEGDAVKAESSLDAESPVLLSEATEGTETIEPAESDKEAVEEAKTVTKESKSPTPSIPTPTPTPKAEKKTAKLEAEKEAKDPTQNEKKETKASTLSKATKSITPATKPSTEVPIKGSKSASPDRISTLIPIPLNFHDTYLQAIPQLLKDIPNLILPDIEKQLKQARAEAEAIKITVKGKKAEKKTLRKPGALEGTLLYLPAAHKQLAKDLALLKTSCAESPELLNAKPNPKDAMAKDPELRRMADAYVVNICRQMADIVTEKADMISKNSPGSINVDAALGNSEKVAEYNGRIQSRFRQLISIVPKLEHRKLISHKIFKKEIREITLGAKNAVQVDVKSIRRLAEEALATTTSSSSSAKVVKSLRGQKSAIHMDLSVAMESDSAKGVLDDLENKFRDVPREDEMGVSSGEMEREIEEEAGERLEGEPKKESKEDGREVKSDVEKKPASSSGESTTPVPIEPIIPSQETNKTPMSLSQKLQSKRNKIPSKSDHATILARVKTRMSEGQTPGYKAKSGSLYEWVGVEAPTLEKMQCLYERTAKAVEGKEAGEIQMKEVVKVESEDVKDVKDIERALPDVTEVEKYTADIKDTELTGGDLKVVSEGTLDMTQESVETSTDQLQKEEEPISILLDMLPDDENTSETSSSTSVRFVQTKPDPNLKRSVKEFNAISTSQKISASPLRNLKVTAAVAKLNESRLLGNLSNYDNDTDDNFSSLDALNTVMSTADLRGSPMNKDHAAMPELDPKLWKRKKFPDLPVESVTSSPSDVLQGMLDDAASLTYRLEKLESNQNDKEEAVEAVEEAINTSDVTTKDPKSSPRKILQDWAAKQIDGISTSSPLKDGTTVATIIQPKEEEVVKPVASSSGEDLEILIEEKVEDLGPVVDNDKREVSQSNLDEDPKPEEKAQGKADKNFEEGVVEERVEEKVQQESRETAAPLQASESKPEEEESKKENLETKQSEPTTEKPKPGWGSWFSMFK